MINGINWNYCKDPNTINEVLEENAGAYQNCNWEGLRSARQIISITWDSHQGLYVVFWRMEEQ